ncbi:MAG: hypothetical protein ACYCSX_09100 [Acidimicrobiales bacterium]
MREYGCKKETGCKKTFVDADRVGAFVFIRVLPLLDDPYVRALAAGEKAAQHEEVQALRVAERRQRIAAPRGHSVLDRFGGPIATRWDELTAGEQRVVVQSIVRVTLGEPAGFPTRSRHPAGVSPVDLLAMELDGTTGPLADYWEVTGNVFP